MDAPVSSLPRVSSVRVRLFQGRTEQVFLWFPVLFFPFVFYEISTGQTSMWSMAQSGWLYFICSTLFLNALHVVFTFKMLLFYPEFRDWHQAFNARSSVSFGVQCFVVFSLALFFFIWGAEQFDALTSAGLSSLFFNLYNARHTLFQIYGFSTIYERRLADAHPELKDSIAHDRKTEKFIYWFIYGVMVLHNLLFIFFADKDAALYRQMQLIGLCISTLPVLLLLRRAHRLQGVAASSFFIYLTRLLFYPLCFISHTAGIVLIAFHGIEYYCMYTNVRSRTKVDSERIPTYFVYGAMVLTLCLLPLRPYGSGLGWLLDANLYRSFSIVSWLSSFVGALAVLHYFIDGKIFRFSKESAGASILSLLIAPGEGNTKPTRP